MLRGRLLSVVRRCFAEPLTLTLLLILAAVTIFPLRAWLAVLPGFSSDYLRALHNQAEITLAHMEETSLDLSGTTPLLTLTAQEYTNFLKTYRLQRLRLFSRYGDQLWPASPELPGNTVKPLPPQLLQGGHLDEIVKKADATPAARILLPLVRNGVLLGAVEMQYSLSAREARLNTLLHREMWTAAIITLLLLAFILITLRRAETTLAEDRRVQSSLLKHKGKLEGLVAQQLDEIRATQEASIHALAVLSEHYDPDTGHHLTRIRHLTELLTTLLEEESIYGSYLEGHIDYCRDIALASMLHDIGKTAIPQEILLKPGPLTDDEFEIIKTHSEIAGEVLYQGNNLFIEKFGKNSYLALAADIALHHHEKWDGSGYPSGLSGETIPLSARIVALTDVYDALCSKRPYKNPWPISEVEKLIEKEAGSHFDPELVRVFLLHKEKFRVIADRYSDF